MKGLHGNLGVRAQKKTAGGGRAKTAKYGPVAGPADATGARNRGEPSSAEPVQALPRPSRSLPIAAGLPVCTALTTSSSTSAGSSGQQV